MNIISQLLKIFYLHDIYESLLNINLHEILYPKR